MEELNKLVQDKNKLLVLAGIIHSERAFVGPEVLHIDLTNWCNFDCIACWCRSPLLKDKAMPDWERKLIIPLDMIKKVFDDLSALGGLHQVKLVGGGEPFMHPNILEIVEYIKSKDKLIEIDINTNFSLVNKEIAKKLLDLGVDSFTVSLWAGTPEVYAGIHPNQTGHTFDKISDVLKFIASKKREQKLNHPKILIHNVIFNRNYRDINKMISFGLDVEADCIQFVPIDIVKDRTEELMLNNKQIRELLDLLYEIRKQYDHQTFDYTSSDGKTLKLSDFEGFIRRIERFDVNTGAYDETVVDEVPCYVGWLFARIMATGDVVPCCKGHRMPMGNIYKNKFKDIWMSPTYNEFRNNCIGLSKSEEYFARIGNDAAAKTGCYNCDNLWQNIPMHTKVTLLKKYNIDIFCGSLLKNLFSDDRKNI